MWTNKYKSLSIFTITKSGDMRPLQKGNVLDVEDISGIYRNGNLSPRTVLRMYDGNLVETIEMIPAYGLDRVGP